jgi:hypothetical protein
VRRVDFIHVREGTDGVSLLVDLGNFNVDSVGLKADFGLALGG